MKLQLFKNTKCLIYGSDPCRISCDIKGVLRIASCEIPISPGTESVVPVLLNGSSGIYQGTFTTTYGAVYKLEKVTIKGGRICPPNEDTVEKAELRFRLDALEKDYAALEEKVRELSNIFDTNSLNFLIK